MADNRLYTLKSARVFRNLTQQELADKLGVHVNTYSDWEKHPENLRIKTAQKIAEILEISAGDIFFGTDTTKCSF